MSLAAFILFVWSCAVAVFPTLQNEMADLHTPKKQDLYVLTFLPYPQPDLPKPQYDEGPTLYLAIEVAAEILNNRTDILKGYRINLLQANSGCSSSQSLYSLIAEGLFHRKSGCQHPIVGAVGPVCSLASTHVGNLAGRRDISLITITLSGAESLDNRDLYPNTFSTFESVKSIVDAMTDLIKHNRWENIGLFIDETRLYYTSMAKLLNNPVNLNLSQVDVSGDNFGPFKDIQNRFRIIILLVDLDLLHKLLCIAFTENFIYPFYQFILVLFSMEDIKSDVNFYSHRWYNCTKDQLNEILEGSIVFSYQLERTDKNFTTSSNISLSEFDDMYERKVEMKNLAVSKDEKIGKSIYAEIAFDAMWSLGLALNASMKTIDLSTYGYGQPNITEQIKSELYSLDFDGLSGKIRFDPDTGRVKHNVCIFVVQKKAKLEKLLCYSENSSQLMSIDRKYFISDQFGEAINTIPKPVVYSLMFTIIPIGFLIPLLLNILTCVYRNMESVKASSIKLNQIAYVSSYLFVIALLLSILEHGYSDVIHPMTLCLLQEFSDYLISIALTLLLGAVFMRTWRLYRIFIHFANPGNLISNWILITGVIIMTVVDIALTVPAFFFDRYQPKFIFLSYSINATDLIKNVKLKCEREVAIPWFLSSLIVSIFLLIGTSILAVLTRKIPQKNFKTQCILYQSYSLTGIISLALGLYIILESDNDNLIYTLRFCILCVLLLCLIFIPSSMLFCPPLIPVLSSKVCSNRPKGNPGRRCSNKQTLIS